MNGTSSLRLSRRVAAGAEFTRGGRGRRLNSWKVHIQVMLLIVAASLTLAAAQPSDTTGAWNPIPGGPGTGCAHDSSYAFFVHPGDSQRLVIYLNGGGACWNNLNCDLHGRGTFRDVIDTTQLPDQKNGIFDFANPRNPARDFTIIFIPYCTGDVFLGAR